ncbi:MAG: beta-ketoacyl synthase N-terminal-like domain-containing protein [Acidobacteriota bacterium]
MSGTEALRLNPAEKPRVFAHGWPEPVVITGFGGAADGPLEASDEALKAFSQQQLDGIKMPPNSGQALGARALVAALQRTLDHPAMGGLPAPEERAMVIGTRLASINETIHFMEQIDTHSATLVNPALFPFTVMNAAAGLAAIQHQCRGANVTFNNGAVSALVALSYAADLVLAGQAEVVFAGGFESLSPRACAALGRNRPAVTVATTFAVTTLKNADRSGALPCARFAGYSCGDLPQLSLQDTRTAVVESAQEAASAKHPEADLEETIGPTPTAARHEEILVDLVEAITACAADTNTNSGSNTLRTVYSGSERVPSGAALVFTGVDDSV